MQARRGSGAAEEAAEAGAHHATNQTKGPAAKYAHTLSDKMQMPAFNWHGNSGIDTKLKYPVPDKNALLNRQKPVFNADVAQMAAKRQTIFDSHNGGNPSPGSKTYFNNHHKGPPERHSNLQHLAELSPLLPQRMKIAPQPPPRAQGLGPAHPQNGQGGLVQQQVVARAQPRQEGKSMMVSQGNGSTSKAALQPTIMLNLNHLPRPKNVLAPEKVELAGVFGAQPRQPN